MNDVARAAYERHMKRTHHVPRLAHTALSTGALRPADIEDVKMHRLPPHLAATDRPAFVTHARPEWLP